MEPFSPLTPARHATLMLGDSRDVEILNCCFYSLSAGSKSTLSGYGLNTSLLEVVCCCVVAMNYFGK